MEGWTAHSAREGIPLGQVEVAHLLGIKFDGQGSIMGIASFRPVLLLQQNKTDNREFGKCNGKQGKARQGGFGGLLALSCWRMEVDMGGGPVTCSGLRFHSACLEDEESGRLGNGGEHENCGGRQWLAACGGLSWMVVALLPTCPAAAAHLFTIPCACPPCAALATRRRDEGRPSTGRLR